MRGPDAEVMDSSCPVVLVVDLGDDDLGCTGQRGQGCGARAAVVDAAATRLKRACRLTSPMARQSGSLSTSDSSAHPRDTIARRPSARAVRIITSLRSCGVRVVLPKPR